MDKANKALRRSGIRLRSVKSGHSSLKLIISDWKESKSAYKSFIANQETAWSDMVKWVSTEHNRGLREVLDHVVQLQGLWTELQTQFLTALKKYQHQFETILESEMQLDKSRAALSCLEVREAKLCKELRKASTKSSVDDLKQIEDKLADVKMAIQNAQMEVAANTTENESIKMLLMKEGLVNLSQQYFEFAEKAAMIFKAQRTVASKLPDANCSVQEMKFNGAETCAAAVAQVKKDLRNYSSGQSSVPAAPPPYYPPTTSHLCDSSERLGVTYFECPPRYTNVLVDEIPRLEQPPDQLPSSPQQLDQQTPYYTDTSETSIAVASSSHYYDTPPDGYGNLSALLQQLRLDQ
ncbi:uncharacterized protein [Rhodnius prolixus]|uniref:Myosin-i heavy chain-like protein n=2 Tax=Rhodnius TaxID=13248 RepID=T1HVV7_RHOPR